MDTASLGRNVKQPVHSKWKAMETMGFDIAIIDSTRIFHLSISVTLDTHVSHNGVKCNLFRHTVEVVIGLRQALHLSVTIVSVLIVIKLAPRLPAVFYSPWSRFPETKHIYLIKHIDSCPAIPPNRLVLKADMSGLNGWVGSWRPHKPRGPIAAMYGSPGPKYALPSATGINDHDPRKYKAPAFSFGLRHRQFSNSCSPGPGYLVPSNITKTGRDGTPAYSLYSRPRDIKVFETPGPGQYCPEKAGKMTAYSAPAYSLSSRSERYRTDQTPGPAAYMLPSVIGPKTVNKRSAPTYSLTGRRKIGSFYEDLQKSPGPGTYGVVETSVYRQKPPQYSMAGRHHMPGDTTRKPGPGSYYPEQVTFTKSKAPSFSFGIRHSEYIAPLIPDNGFAGQQFCPNDCVECADHVF